MWKRYGNSVDSIRLQYGMVAVRYGCGTVRLRYGMVAVRLQYGTVRLWYGTDSNMFVFVALKTVRFGKAIKSIAFLYRAIKS